MSVTIMGRRASEPIMLLTGNCPSFSITLNDSCSCSKIITSPGPSVGDHHGCPFRHHGPESLRGTLSNYSAPGGAKLSKEQVDQILELVAGNHHQLACTKLFEISRKINTVLDTITYPSKFYELSIQNVQKN